MPPLYRRKSSLGLNLTPLIDVVFLLLVFFMLTAHFVEEEALTVELPEAASGAAAEADEILEVTVAADGRIAVAGHEVAEEELQAQLRSRLHARSDKRVRLRGDAGIDLGLTVRVMDAARLAGASALDIVTEQP